MDRVVPLVKLMRVTLEIMGNGVEIEEEVLLSEVVLLEI